jgi:hypothetical protein
MSQLAVDRASARHPALDPAVRRIGQLQPHLPVQTSLLIAVAAAVVTLAATWPLVRHLSTAAHEGAHAMMGSGLGHRVASVRLARDGTGVTSIAAAAGSRGPGVLTAVVGYLGPSLFGLAAAELIRIGHIVAVLWLGLLALLVILPLLRGAFGCLSVLVTGGLLFLVAWQASLGVQVGLAYGIAWFLLLAGVREVLEHGSGAADAALLRRLTLVPRGFWSALWLASTAAALIIGARLLL